MVYGNRYKEVKPAGMLKNMRHKWTMFVEFEQIGDQEIDPNLLIDKVRYGLHSTFRNSHVDVNSSESQNFEFCYVGWGEFEIPITINFKKGVQFGDGQGILKLDHMLCFQGRGKWREIVLQLRKSAVKELGIQV